MLKLSINNKIKKKIQQILILLLYYLYTTIIWIIIQKLIIIIKFTTVNFIYFIVKTFAIDFNISCSDKFSSANSHSSNPHFQVKNGKSRTDEINSYWFFFEET